jgi:hypothetical protein
VKKNIILKAYLKDKLGRLRLFRPEVDNGCTITCIHPRVVKKFGLKVVKLPFSIPVVNADGTDNKQGTSNLAVEVYMMVGDHTEIIEALILDIGANEMLLGLDWLAVHNPLIDWSEGELHFVRCPEMCKKMMFN